MLLLAHNMTDYTDFAAKRFREDIAVLNFFFDTPIITQIKLELRTSVFDMISAIGGTLGLFTGISVITFVEIGYWIVRFFLEGFKKSSAATTSCFKGVFGDSDGEFKRAARSNSVGVAVDDEGRSAKYATPLKQTHLSPSRGYDMTLDTVY